MTSRSTPATTPQDCRAQLDAVLGYLDGDLTPARRRAIEQHLRRCDCCGDLVDSLRRAVALSHDRGVRVPPAVVARARANAKALLASAISPRARSGSRRTR